jgi:hypothetical protein
MEVPGDVEEEGALGRSLQIRIALARVVSRAVAPQLTDHS